MNEPRAYIYIMTNMRNGTLYTGVTNNLAKRVHEHKAGLVKGFTQKYGLKTLVYYELYPSIDSAIYREKCIKEWKRIWKLKLIEDFNPQWHDLSETLNA